MGKRITLERFLGLLLVMQLAVLVFKSASVETWGVNKTVGWAWDFTNIIFLAKPLLTVYLLTYFLLFAFKVKQQLALSLLSIILLLIIFTFPSDIFAILAFLSSIILFLVNCIYSIYHKFKKTA